jgi:ribonuclease Z
MIDVCLLGIGGMMPLPDRPLSAALVRVGGETTLFDAGEGTQVNWRLSGWPFRPTSTILLSHAHADHIAGLPGILFQIAHSGRTEPVTVYGSQWTTEVVSALLTIVGLLPYELRVVELEGGESIALPGGLTLRTLALRHRLSCLAYAIEVARRPEFDPERARLLGVPLEHWRRLQDGETVAGIRPEQVLGPARRGLKLSLITDTRYFDGLAEFVANSDLLICESMYADDDDEDQARERGHMTIRQATSVAAKAGARALWLTHFSPRVENPGQHLSFARGLFANTEIGPPGRKTTLRFEDG